MLFKFTDNLNLGKSANTRKTEITESCEEEQKKEQRDSAQCHMLVLYRGNISTM